MQKQNENFSYINRVNIVVVESVLMFCSLRIQVDWKCKFWKQHLLFLRRNIRLNTGGSQWKDKNVKVGNFRQWTESLISQWVWIKHAGLNSGSCIYKVLVTIYFTLWEFEVFILFRYTFPTLILYYILHNIRVPKTETHFS